MATDIDLYLAPMAGATDAAFRTIVAEYGADTIYSEMVSAKALCHNDKRTQTLLQRHEGGGRYVIQLFGREPETMARAAAMLDMADSIDINLGCPAPKITKNGEGSALLKEPKLVGKIVSAVVKACNCPVSVKIRSGWESINAVEIAKIAEDSGASEIMVHPRTKVQAFTGKADWSIIRDVKNAISIKVIGNGDVQSHKDAHMMIHQTGCDAVAIGRATLGAPWIFEEIKKELHRAEPMMHLINHNFAMRNLTVAMRHIELLVHYKGERTGILEARKHASWYIKGLPGAASVRQSIVKANTLEDMKRILHHLNAFANSDGD